MSQPLICGFLKVRNEIVREGNLYRVLTNMDRYCDTIVVCDDASMDGSREFLQAHIQAENLILVPPEQQDFRKELLWKQRMLERVHQIKPQWVMWMDADQVLDAPGMAGLRAFAEEKLSAAEVAWRFHFSQFWRNTSWARTDSQFDDGYFICLWRWSPDLAFSVVEGTHQNQFPAQLLNGLISVAPFEVLHYGNAGKNLIWKCLQYYGGLGGVDRHLRFQGASYRAVDQTLLPPEVELIPGETPKPFTEAEMARILALEGLRGLRGHFCVVVPAYNRARTLPQALESLLAQTYEKWVAIVLDDGSTDDTRQVMREWQERDPRIFYCRYQVRRGGVAVNEIGMAMACEVAEYWTRLGSDDWFEPHKLALDAAALEQGHNAVYGPYQVVRGGQRAEVCNVPEPPEQVQAKLLGRHAPVSVFVASWVNCAVRTSVLRQVREKYGAFCDSRLVMMEDFLFNARVVRFVPWVWRGQVDGGLIVNPSAETCTRIAGSAQNLWGQAGIVQAPGFLVDAAWTVAADGASGNTGQTAVDDDMTRRIIQEENARD